MSNPLKETPKSCGCRSCRRGKGCESGAAKTMMKMEERAARHQNKVDLKKGNEVILPAHRGSRTD